MFGQCGPILISLTLGALFGSYFTQSRSGDLNYEQFEEHCDDTMESTVVTSFCFSHHHTEKESLAERLPNSDMNFLVLGDWGRNGHCCQNDVALEMSRVDFADFVINTGDNFYENGLQSSTDKKIKTSWHNVYNKKNLLKIPWYSVLGNHDYHSDSEPELHISYESWKLPDRNWRIIKGNVLFVFIDTSPMLKDYDHDGKISPHLPDIPLSERRKQILEQAEENLKLSASEKNVVWKIAVGHHPVITAGEHYAEDEDYFFERDFARFLEDQGVNVYFSGHDHNMQHLKKGKVELIISGAGSKIRPFPDYKTHLSSFSEDTSEGVVRFHYGEQGFVSVSVTDERILIQFLNLRGVWLYSTIVTR